LVVGLVMRVEGLGVLEDAADVEHRHLAHARVAVAREERLALGFHSDWWQCMPEPLSP
jgi:hypothetical protein